MYDSLSNPQNSPSPGISKMCSAFFVLSKIIRDIENFVQISILLNKTEIVKI